MRYKLTLLFLIITSIIFAQKADDIIGKYHLPNKLDIQIFKHKEKFYGKIIALNNFEDGQTTDINNDNKEKQNKPLIGMIIIKDLEFDNTDKEWINGKMYGPEKGMFFDLKITELRKNEIEVVGSKFFFWKTLIWEKI